MQTNTRTLILDTDYKTTGNSTGCGIDTLGIAFNFGDSNDIYELNYEFVSEGLKYTRENWLKNNAESFFRKLLNKEQLIEYANNLDEYEKTLAQYKDTFDDVNSYTYDENNDAQKDLATTLDKAEGDLNDELYKLWLHGDYSDFGLLQTAQKHYSDYEIEFDDAKQGNVSATISDNTLQSLIDDGELDENLTIDDVFVWLQDDINYKAHNVFEREQKRRAESKIERERIAEYKAKQKQNEAERKKAELLALIK